MEEKLDDWNEFQLNLECLFCILAFFYIYINLYFIFDEPENISSKQW